MRGTGMNRYVKSVITLGLVVLCMLSSSRRCFAKESKEVGTLQEFRWKKTDERYLEPSIETRQEVPEDAEVLEYRLFNEFEYNLTFWLPIGEYVSFEETFGNRDTKILCIVLPKCGQFVFRRRLRIEKKIQALYIPADSLQEADRKAEAFIVLGIWHQYLDLSNPHNKKVFIEREKYYAIKGRYPEV